MAPDRRVMLKHQVQHGHEVRLTGAETAVQVARLAADGLNRRADEVEGIVEARRQLRRDDVLLQRLLRLGDALGQVEDEVSLPHPVGQNNQFTDEFFRHGQFFLARRRVVVAGGCQPLMSSRVRPSSWASCSSIVWYDCPAVSPNSGSISGCHW